MKKNATSARYEGILLIPAMDADFCQELLDMPCDEGHNPVEYTGIGKYADVRSFGLTFPNGSSKTDSPPSCGLSTESSRLFPISPCTTQTESQCGAWMRTSCC